MGDARRLLRGAVRDGLGTGWQLVIDDVRSDRIELAEGTDALAHGVRSDSRFCTYCAAKPLLAMGIAAAVDEGELSWNDFVGDLLPGANEVTARRTVRSLLDHTAGVLRPSAVETTVLPGSRRLEAALDQVPRVLPAGSSAYSEAAAWVLAGAVLESAVGQTAAVYVTDRVLRPLDLVDEFDLGVTAATDGKFRMNVSVRGGRRWPLLLERTASLDWSTNPGYGGRASTRGLVGLASEVLRALNGKGAVLGTSVARDLITPGYTTFDTVWDRPCSFGLGWLVGLDEHRFGRAIPATAFGQVGLVGMTALWAVPEVGYAAGYHINGLSDGATAIDWLRGAVTDAVHSALLRR